jgi:hypothetical protein
MIEDHIHWTRQGYKAKTVSRCVVSIGQSKPARTRISRQLEGRSEASMVEASSRVKITSPRALARKGKILRDRKLVCLPASESTEHMSWILREVERRFNSSCVKRPFGQNASAFWARRAPGVESSRTRLVSAKNAPAGKGARVLGTSMTWVTSSVRIGQTVLISTRSTWRIGTLMMRVCRFAVHEIISLARAAQRCVSSRLLSRS